MLPGGKAILFTLVTDVDERSDRAECRWDKAQIVVHKLPSSTRKTLIDGGSHARYLPSGHIVYAVGGVLFAAPFDVSGRADGRGDAGGRRRAARSLGRSSRVWLNSASLTPARSCTLRSPLKSRVAAKSGDH